MLIIPPQNNRTSKPADPHELTVGMLVVACIMLAISLFIFIVGPRSHNPPPPIVGYAVLSLAVLFGFIAFFAWMKEQGDDTNSES